MENFTQSRLEKIIMFAAIMLLLWIYLELRTYNDIQTITWSMWPHIRTLKSELTNLGTNYLVPWEVESWYQSLT